MTDPAYFERMYAGSDDPWHLDGNPYEQRKYALTVASLPRQRYRRGFEPGCSIGLLTALLASRCDELVATDPVAEPLATARARVTAPHVTFEQSALPDWPDGELDLVVLSEVLYFLSAEVRAQVLARVIERLDTDGHVVLVDWRHRFAEAACTGDEAHTEFRDSPGLTRLVQHVEDDFLLEVFCRA